MGKWCLLIGVLAWAGTAYADLGSPHKRAKESNHHFFVGAGVLTHPYQRTFVSNTSGVVTADPETSRFGQLYPAVSLHGKLGYSPRLDLQPTLTLTPLPRGTVDDAASIMIFAGSLLGSLNVGILDFKLGPGVFLFRTSGNGGTTIQKNGSSTSEFALPSGVSWSRLLYLDAGLGVEIAGPIRVDFDVIASGVRSTRKTFSFLGSVSYVVF